MSRKNPKKGSVGRSLTRAAIYHSMDDRYDSTERMQKMVKRHVRVRYQPVRKTPYSDRDCRLVAAMERLESRHRKVLALRYCFLLRRVEIGEMLGMQKDAVRLVLRQALRYVRTVCGPYDEPVRNMPLREVDVLIRRIQKTAILPKSTACLAKRLPEHLKATSDRRREKLDRKVLDAALARAVAQSTAAQEAKPAEETTSPVPRPVSPRVLSAQASRLLRAHRRNATRAQRAVEAAGDGPSGACVA